jgi:hypothetical protein
MPYSNFLIEQFKGKDFQHFLPANMNSDILNKIATLLTEWKYEEQEEDERLVIETFACFWGRTLLVAQKSPLVVKLNIKKYGRIPVFLLMGELEFLVHQEIVSRHINYCTYDRENIFEPERLKRTTLDFLCSYLKHHLLGPFAEGEFFTLTISSISKYLEQ